MLCMPNLSLNREWLVKEPGQTSVVIYLNMEGNIELMVLKGVRYQKILEQLIGKILLTFPEVILVVYLLLCS